MVLGGVCGRVCGGLCRKGLPHLTPTLAPPHPFLWKEQVEGCRALDNLMQFPRYVDYDNSSPKSSLNL